MSVRYLTFCYECVVSTDNIAKNFDKVFDSINDDSFFSDAVFISCISILFPIDNQLVQE